MKFYSFFAVILVTDLVVALFATAAPTFASATLSYGSETTRVIAANDLRTIFAKSKKPAPGRSALPLESSPSRGGDGMKLKFKSTRLAKHLPTKRSHAVAKAVAAARTPAQTNYPLVDYVRTLKVGWRSPTPLLSSGPALAVNDSYLVTSADFMTENWVNSGDVKVFYNDQPVQLIGFDLGSNLAVFSTGLGSHMESSLALPRLKFDSHMMSSLLGRPAGSGEQAFEMIRQLEKRPPIAISRGVLAQQATALQQHWTDAFFNGVRAESALRDLSCGAESLHVSEPAVASELLRTKLVRCHQDFPAPLTHEYAMDLELVSGEVSFVNDVRTYLANDLSKTTVFAAAPVGERSPASVNLLTSPECEQSNVLNKAGREMQVRFCTSALKTASGLNDSTMTVISTDTGARSSVRSLRLHGFDAKNSKRFLEWLIDAETIR